MKKIGVSIFTLIVIVIINFVGAKFFNLEFLELSFFIGLISMAFIGFFSSSGGPTTSSAEVRIKHLLESDSRTDAHKFKFYNNAPFMVCVAYTIIAAICSVIFYWRYF